MSHLYLRGWKKPLIFRWLQSKFAIIVFLCPFGQQKIVMKSHSRPPSSLKEKNSWQNLVGVAIFPFNDCALIREEQSLSFPPPPSFRERISHFRNNFFYFFVLKEFSFLFILRLTEPKSMTQSILFFFSCDLS